jgi:hypothetical protein
VIYFIQRGEDGPIKVGTSTDPVERLRSLQTSNAEPLTLLGFMPGGSLEERAIHALLEDGRLEGEWFSPDTPGLQGLLSNAGHGEYLILALGEADEKARSWQARRNELVDEILVYCSRFAPTKERQAA